MARPTKIPTPRFNLRSHDPIKDKDTSTLIVLVLRYNKKRLVWSTREKIKPRFWDQKKNRAKITVNNSQDSHINKTLNTISSKAIDIFREHDGNISISDFKKELDISFGRIRREETDGKYIPFMEFLDHYIEERQKRKNAKRGTWKNLQTAANHIKKFIKEKYPGKTIDYNDIDWKFRFDFEDWLYKKPREHSNNYASKQIDILKHFLIEAHDEGFHTNQIYNKKKKWNIEKEKTTKVVLSFEELEQLNNLDLSKNKRLDRVRDLFLIGAYSGLRFSDFTRIKPENIITEDGFELLEIYTQKTDTRVTIPLLPELKQLLEKYGDQPPKISNQKLNDYIKEICKIAGFDQLEPIKKTKGGKRINETKEKHELITSHTARRSFATNFYKMGFPASELMKITGHATERQFLNYINITTRENAKSIAAKMARMRGKSPLKKVN